MAQFMFKAMFLAVVAMISGFIGLGTQQPHEAKAERLSVLDVVTIEAEKPDVASNQAAIVPNVSLLPLESYKPSVKSDETKDKLAALDERVTQLESKFKTFSSTKSSNGSTGGGSTGSVAAKTVSQGSVGGGSTGSSGVVVYQSQAVPYVSVVAQPVYTRPVVRAPIVRRMQSTGTCTVDQYGRVICK